MENPRVACLVPARSGSRRVAAKNLQLVDGRSLLERSIDVAVQAFGRVWVSTDDDEYAALAESAGATVPGLRPASLAQDTTPMDEVIAHALREWLPDREFFVLVQPTSPFTIVNDLTGVVDALVASPDAGCALTAVVLGPAVSFALVQEANGLYRYLAPEFSTARTQDVPRIVQPTGGAYASRVARLRLGQPLVVEPLAVVEVPANRALDIDDPADLARAQGR